MKQLVSGYFGDKTSIQVLQRIVIALGRDI